MREERLAAAGFDPNHGHWWQRNQLSVIHPMGGVHCLGRSDVRRRELGFEVRYSSQCAAESRFEVEYPLDRCESHAFAREFLNMA